MGYTHYWKAGTDPEQWKLAFPRLVTDTRTIIRAAARGDIAICGPDGTGEPILTPDVIELNGSSLADDDYETFAIGRSLGSFEFCKTGRRPYDVVACAILLRATILAPNGTAVRSDGTWDEWSDARRLVTNLFGDVPACPWDES